MSCEFDSYDFVEFLAVDKNYRAAIAYYADLEEDEGNRDYACSLRKNIAEAVA